jgi:DnaK suppressor protein
VELFKMMDACRADGLMAVGYATEYETLHARVDDGIDFTVIQVKSMQIANIEWALRRLQEGSYGRCADCNGEIACQRLAAIPFARRCRECQEAAEKATEKGQAG